MGAGPSILDRVKPYLRPVRHAHLRWMCERIARAPGPHDQTPAPPPAGFVVGCGRSGTTILGKMLTIHPEICYLFEPYHLWASVERRTDVANLHYDVDGLFMMDASHATPEARLRFNRLVYGARARSGRPLVVEKTPHNVVRIGFLDALAPGSRFIHIVRSGLDVARSIDRLATTSTYRNIGRPTYNQWWGVDDKKWIALARDGAAAGYFPDEVGGLRSHEQRGAYEWLVSLGEAERRRPTLGDRLLEIQYARLTADARGTLTAICRHLGAGAPEPWLARAAGMVESERKNKGQALRLPPAMASAFNAWMDRYGFEGRAEPEAVA